MMTLNRRRTVIAAGGTAIALSLTGCLGGEEKKTPAAQGKNKAGATQVLTKASDQVKQAGTYRERTVSEVAIGTGSEKSTTRRVSDMRIRTKPDFATAGTITATGTRGGKQVQPRVARFTEMITIGRDSAWVRLRTQPPGGKPWMKLPAGSGELINQTEEDGPSEAAKKLAAAKDLRELGTETIDGTTTTHYGGTVDLGEGNRPYIEMWVGADNLPRKQTTKLTIPEMGPVQETSLFSEYGKPVTIAPPPADQVGKYRP